MIVKAFSQSLYSEALTALSKRLPRLHPKYASIKEEQYRIAAGDAGEEAVMKKLESLTLPCKHYVFHNISLYGDSLFQMDLLIITPYFAMILEVKNIKGTIELLTNPSQLKRTLETGEVHTFDSPEPQLEESMYQLTRIFKEHNIDLPIRGAIVFAFAKNYIKTITNQTTILLRNEVPSYVRKINRENPILSDADLEKLKEYLLKKDVPFKPFPLSSYFSIPASEIKSGVECSNCSFIGMLKLPRTWYCPKCRKFEHKAHEQTIREYFLLYKGFITNKDCRQFFQLNNLHEATRILNGSNLMKTGNGKNTKYFKMDF
ncbi:nuclease-related domain-containing protein [Psychrobacillus vulpis]|uniref:NERD domain-containing protein n=1 Tax=Psychrobacillus vulpis TaxID=2325572 RepID=A0A544TUU1_9BACI|nr:nuclease-related domain-containing protein [Psychrobacillus vulpis]TQR21214.1 NERD domain-containing protein [Psychrobacillus vulpis]